MPEDGSRKFGEFLDGLLHPREVESRDEWAGGLQKDLERFCLPKRLDRAEKELAALKRAARTDTKRGLWHLVATVKRKNPGKRSDHQFIALRVDRLFEKGGAEFCKECPKSWCKVSNPPRSLKAALDHADLRKRVRSWISRVS